MVILLEHLCQLEEKKFPLNIGLVKSNFKMIQQSEAIPEKMHQLFYILHP